MGTCDLQIFVVRYVGNELQNKSINIAVCVSETSRGGPPFLGCECTEDWEELEALFPDADIDFLKDWCDALRKDFCSPDTNRSVQERLQDCSSSIDTSISRRTLEATANPREEMRKLVQTHLGKIEPSSL